MIRAGAGKEARRADVKGHVPRGEFFFGHNAHAQHDLPDSDSLKLHGDVHTPTNTENSCCGDLCSLLPRGQKAENPVSNL